MCGERSYRMKPLRGFPPFQTLCFFLLFIFHTPLKDRLRSRHSNGDLIVLTGPYLADGIYWCTIWLVGSLLSCSVHWEIFNTSLSCGWWTFARMLPRINRTPKHFLSRYFCIKFWARCPDFSLLLVTWIKTSSFPFFLGSHLFLGDQAADIDVCSTSRIFLTERIKSTIYLYYRFIVSPTCWCAFHLKTGIGLFWKMLQSSPWRARSSLESLGCHAGCWGPKIRTSIIF